MTCYLNVTNKDLKATRKAKGLNQTELGALAGVAPHDSLVRFADLQPVKMLRNGRTAGLGEAATQQSKPS
jgi:hypothetical protein